MFKGAPKPALLKRKANFQVINGNMWKHAPSLSAMAESAVTIRLGRSVKPVVDLKDRSDAEACTPTGDLLDPSSGVRTVFDTTTNIASAISFTSAPFESAMEVSGVFLTRAAAHRDSRSPIRCSALLQFMKKSNHRIVVLDKCLGDLRGSA